RAGGVLGGRALYVSERGGLRGGGRELGSDAVRLGRGQHVSRAVIGVGGDVAVAVRLGKVELGARARAGAALGGDVVVLAGHGCTAGPAGFGGEGALAVVVDSGVAVRVGGGDVS